MTTRKFVKPTRLKTEHSKLIKKTIAWPGLNGMDLAEEVSTKKNYTWVGLKTWNKEKGYKKNNKKKYRVIAIDYGIKKNILRYFSNFDCEVKVVPCNENPDNLLKLNHKKFHVRLPLLQFQRTW